MKRTIIALPVTTLAVPGSGALGPVIGGGRAIDRASTRQKRCRAVRR